MKVGRCILAGPVALGLVGLFSAPAVAVDFYAGKTITMIVGNDVGGGFDAYARLFARHLPRVIPGQPTIVVQNMPGAGSSTATAYVNRVAAKDGTVIGVVTPGAIAAPLFDEQTRRNYDPAKLIYLTSADSGSRVCAIYHAADVKTGDDARQKKVIIGAAGAGSSSSDYAKLHRTTSGLKFEIVSGYKGTGDLLLAMERREIDGLCGVDWASLTSQRPDWIRDKKLNFLFQVGVKPHDVLTRMGVPDVSTSTLSPDDLAVVELVTSQQVFARPFIAAPEVPGEQIATLRAAFESLYKDPGFIADAEKSQLILAPTSGAEVQRSVEKMYKAAPNIVEKARAVLK